MGTPSTVCYWTCRLPSPSIFEQSNAVEQRDVDAPVHVVGAEHDLVSLVKERRVEDQCTVAAVRNPHSFSSRIFQEGAHLGLVGVVVGEGPVRR